MKKEISVALVLIMLFSLFVSPFGFTLTANAQKIATEEQIGALFDEMTESMALAMIADDESIVQNCEAKIVKIEQQLEALGVDNLSTNEVNQFLRKNDPAGINGLITAPADTNTVKWYLYDYTNYSFNSKKYDIQKLIAVGNNPGGMLVTGEDNVEFYSNEEKLANAVLTVASIVAQKTIGSVPVIKWTPYELLFSSSSTNVFNSNYVTHRCVSSIAFFYVKESTQSDNNYILSFFSNKLSLAVNTHGASVVDSVPTTYSDHKTGTISADYYNSLPAAIQAYLGTISCYDYIYYYDITSYDEEYTQKAYVPAPLAGPGQVF